jgi:oligopeptide transport system ATP-binding protein
VSELAEVALRVEGLSKSFPVRKRVRDIVGRRTQRVVAVDGVSFDLRQHQTLGIVGESGSGKSTLAKCLVRLVEPDDGKITFHGTDVRAAKGDELARIRRAMQLIYQDPYSSLNPLMTVRQAVREAAVVHGLVSKQRAEDYVAEVLEMVGLSPSIASRRPGQLSGGQRQRVAIARAMAVRPQLLIADEPISALDVSIQAQILNLFEALRLEQGVGIIFIAHQLSVIAHSADHVMVMYLGRIVESGAALEVFTRPGHPYTIALLRSQPSRHRPRRDREPVLEAEIPSPLNIPSGCRFRTRCPLAQEICKEVDPPAVVLEAGHTAWCHFAGEVQTSSVESTQLPKVTSASDR